MIKGLEGDSYRMYTDRKKRAMIRRKLMNVSKEITSL